MYTISKIIKEYKILNNILIFIVFCIFYNVKIKNTHKIHNDNIFIKYKKNIEYNKKKYKINSFVNMKEDENIKNSLFYGIYLFTKRTEIINLENDYKLMLKKDIMSSYNKKELIKSLLLIKNELNDMIIYSDSIISGWSRIYLDEVKYYYNKISNH